MSQNDNFEKHERLLAECDLLIKAGKISAVQSRISRVNLAQVPRPYRQALAKICRRAGLINHGLRLLQPLIRNEKSEVEPPHIGEICEYSVLLSRNGSVQEALTLLESMGKPESPDAMLSLAYCYMAKWEYMKAIGFLESFLGSNADEYSKLIACVNLASSYLSTSQLNAAERLCTDTISKAARTGANRLVGNCLEIRGQVYLHSGRFAAARDDLRRASEIFGGTQSYDQLFVRKWLAVMESIEEKSIASIRKFRKEAVERKHWESVRESDLFATKIQFDQKTLDYLVFGTPMPGYRMRIEQIVGAPASQEFVYGRDGALCLDLSTGKFAGGEDMNPGKKVHQVIGAFLKDFYVPRNIGTLFSELYPQEYFDINSSTLRVRQLLWRTRHWLKENEVPATIQQNGGTYRFVVQGDFGIKIRLDQEAIHSHAARWMQIKEAFPKSMRFSAEEACEKLGWSRTSFRAIATWAINAGQMRKTGVGKATLYFIPASERAGSLGSAA